MASVFDPLIALTRSPITREDLNWMLDQLDGGKDSIAAIVGGSFAETFLRDAIIVRLVESKSNHRALFTRNGPLSSFDAMILLAYAIGIIDKDTRHDLTAIRIIRNAFAHSPRELSMETQEVKSICDSLNAIKSYPAGTDVSTPRKQFNRALHVNLALLVTKRLDAEKTRASAPPSSGK
jgi:hypothetical protein